MLPHAENIEHLEKIFDSTSVKYLNSRALVAADHVAVVVKKVADAPRHGVVLALVLGLGRGLRLLAAVLVHGGAEAGQRAVLQRLGVSQRRHRTNTRLLQGLLQPGNISINKKYLIENIFFGFFFFLWMYSTNKSFYLSL